MRALIAFVVLYSVLLCTDSTVAQDGLASSSQIRNEDCLFEIAGVIRINGPCRTVIIPESSSQDEVNGFFGPKSAAGQISASVIAYDFGRGVGRWSGPAGQDPEAIQLGPMKLIGQCWVNATARICGWNSPKTRTALPPAQLPTLPLQYDLPDIEVDQRCFSYGTTMTNPPMAEKRCLASEQADYDFLKRIWTEVPEKGREICLRRILKHIRLLGYNNVWKLGYGGLLSCVTPYIEAQSLRGQGPFRR